MSAETKNKNTEHIDAMFEAGAHFGYSKSRRHPTVAPYIFGAKNQIEIIDLEKTQTLLDKAREFVSKISSERGQILFVSSKKEAEQIIKSVAESLEMPYVVGRWIGGTFTNFIEIRKRVDRMLDLTHKREKGELGKYTKRERMLIDKDIVKLERFFAGITLMKQLPKAIFVVDSRKESIAVAEAKKMNIPVVSLCGSDCDITAVEHPIVANDSSMPSIEFFVQEMARAYREGLLRVKDVPQAAEAVSTKVK